MLSNAHNTSFLSKEEIVYHTVVKKQVSLVALMVGNGNEHEMNVNVAREMLMGRNSEPERSC